MTTKIIAITTAIVVIAMLAGIVAIVEITPITTVYADEIEDISIQ